MSEHVENADAETVEAQFTDDTDLDTFSDIFHGKTPEPKAKEEPVDNADLEDQANEAAPVDETDIEDDDLADEPDKVEAKPQPKKNRAQERIEQLLEKERLANERAAVAEARLKDLEAKGKSKDEAPAPKEDKAPHWDDLNEDGSEKYPLGQFDPQFAEDHVRYLMDKRMAEAEAKMEQEREAQKTQAARDAAQKDWEAKLAPAQERYPDFSDKGADLVEALSTENLEPDYGDYLTNVILSMENGPDVLYYLGSHIEEAKNIVKMGPMGATIALGGINASFSEKPKVVNRQSKAPPPPPTNKGNSAAVPEVADDTDDLEAFEAKFFKRA